MADEIKEEKLDSPLCSNTKREMLLNQEEGNEVKYAKYSR